MLQVPGPKTPSMVLLPGVPLRLSSQIRRNPTKCYKSSSFTVFAMVSVAIWATATAIHPISVSVESDFLEQVSLQLR